MDALYPDSSAERPRTAHVGDIVEWTDNDFVAHAATAKNGTWDVNPPMNGKGSLSLGKAGAIDCYCGIHPNMAATITVTGNSG